MPLYFPPFGESTWARTEAEAAGLKADSVRAAIAHAEAHDSPLDCNLARHLESGHF